jgi:hypothetical protein
MRFPFSLNSLTISVYFLSVHLSIFILYVHIDYIKEILLNICVKKDSFDMKNPKDQESLSASIRVIIGLDVFIHS